MKKLSYKEVKDLIEAHNEKEGVKYQFSDPSPLEFVVVFTKESFKENYTIKERSYKFRSDNKRFINGMLGNSLYGNCLDGKDLDVRLDWYEWIPEYYYQLN